MQLLPHGEHSGRDLVAVVLAVGISVALTLFVVGLLVINATQSIALSENATQVLTAAFSGIIGGLAGYLGGRSNQPPRE